MLRFAVLAVAALGCVRAGSNLPWWKIGPVYQIFPASFADSDGDGWGDLQGIIDHANYIADLGVGAIWLSPIYPSPMMDNGYDVLNFRDINPSFGNLSVFDELVKTFHDKGIKVVLDFVPNHSSNESAWFQDSIYRRNGKEDWYVWKDPKGVNQTTGEFIPPNNWVSTFGGPAWEYVPQRKQFYYHKFAPYQTDFNYSNPAVLEEMKETLRFWLRRGVDGFRMDAVPFIAERNYTRDEPLRPGCSQNATNDCLDHVYTMNVNLTHVVLDSFDAVLREPEFNGSRAMWEEANNDVPELMTYYGQVSSPFNFQYISNIERDWNASQFQKYTKEYMDALDGRWPNWVIGNHDNPRIGTRMGPEMIDSMNIIALLLPGTAITYYGEELGMENAKDISLAYRKDWATNPSRDPSRTPMQWNASTNAGFSTADSRDLYLPVNPNYYKVNVQNESAANSHLNIYKRLVKMHVDNVETTQKGFKTSTRGSWIFAFQRPGLVIITNLNNLEETLVIDELGLNKTGTLTVALAPKNTKLTEGMKVEPSLNITLMPRSSVVFTTGGAVYLQVSSLLLAACLLLLWRNH